MTEARKQATCPSGGSCATGRCARSSGAPLLLAALLLVLLGLWTGEANWLWLAAMAGASGLFWAGVAHLARGG